MKYKFILLLMLWIPSIPIHASSSAHFLTDKSVSFNSSTFLLSYENDSLKLFNKQLQKIIFKIPSPPFTLLQISDDQKYIFALSTIKKRNPYQIVIYDIHGNILKKRSISSTEAKLSSKQFKRFKKSFDVQYKFLDSLKLCYYHNDYFYLDFLVASLSNKKPSKFHKAQKFLLKHEYHNHLSFNFVSQSKGELTWFLANNPQIQYFTKNGLIAGFSFLDPLKNRIWINLKENYCSDN